MKYWWNGIVRNYLTFSRRERNGLFLCIVLGVIIYMLPTIFKPKQQVLNDDTFARDIAQLKVSIDTSKSFSNYRSLDDGNNYFQPKRYDDNNGKGELFSFDPNTLDAAGWKRLGLRDKTIATIQKFTSKGFKFRKPEDIRRVYGLKPEQADRLIPFINIAEAEGSRKDYASTFSETKVYAGNAAVPVKTNNFKPTIIDINEADTSALIALPGIGSKLALRIINFRDKLGGFHSVNQVAETYGVPDSTFQKIRTRLQCNTPSVKKININLADINEMKAHPYLKFNLANAIINYRTQHGQFKSVDDILRINIITEEVFSKVSPYLAL